MTHLAGFTGVLQVDGYGGYRALADKGDVKLAFCWAHVRRRFLANGRRSATTHLPVRQLMMHPLSHKAAPTPPTAASVGSAHHAPGVASTRGLHWRIDHRRYVDGRDPDQTHLEQADTPRPPAQISTHRPKISASDQPAQTLSP